MNLRGRYFELIDYLDEAPWLDVLEKAPFWRAPSVFHNSERDHVYFTLMKYNTMIHDCADPNPLSAFSAPVPRQFSEQQQVVKLWRSWASAHERIFGPGNVAKSGLFVFQPGASSHYHVDGNVFDKGQVVDLEQRREWEIIAFNQAARRTILPLIMNSEDEFLIMGSKIRMTPGLFFEFSNCLPHAFFNKGKDHTVLLVTSYIADADCYKPNLMEL